MSGDIVLDIETQNTFQEIGKHDPSLLKVSLVGVYFYKTGEFKVYFERELKDLWPLLEHSEKIIGYNIKGFDFPVLNNYYPGDMMRLPCLDIMEEAVKKIGHRIKLDDIASATLGEHKSGTGLAAIEYWKTGNLEKLKSYCLDDVRLTRDIYEYGKANGLLKYSGWGGESKEIRVDFKAGAGVLKRPAINLTMSI